MGEKALGWSYPSQRGYARAQNAIAVARTGTQPHAIRTFLSLLLAFFCLTNTANCDKDGYF